MLVAFWFVVPSLLLAKHRLFKVRRGFTRIGKMDFGPAKGFQEGYYGRKAKRSVGFVGLPVDGQSSKRVSTRLCPHALYYPRFRQWLKESQTITKKLWPPPTLLSFKVNVKWTRKWWAITLLKLGTSYFLPNMASSKFFQSILNIIPCIPLDRILVSRPRNMRPETPLSAITFRTT